MSQGAIVDSDARVVGAEVYFLPVSTRVPLKFGHETLTSVTCARARVILEGTDGRRAAGWGETPLSVQWVWPSQSPYENRNKALQTLCVQLARRWSEFEFVGSAMEIGHAFQREALPNETAKFNESLVGDDPLPLLAALVCCSPFDIAVHDAYGVLQGRPVFETLSSEFMKRDLSHYVEPLPNTGVDFRGKHPCDFLSGQPATSLVAWHLVGGLDPIDERDLDGTEPEDGHPVLLSDWIVRDGLRCLKVKLRGTDSEWDYNRLIRVGRVARRHGVEHLTADFNCTVTDPRYVMAILDRLEENDPGVYESLLYIEQPFPYDLESNQIDVHPLSERLPLLMDESAHHWRLVRLGHSLGWNGVALKTCKTFTGAILSLCWAKAHGMHVMVQDLTNPMLAQAPHTLLAAHCDTMMGVETNSMQFYPDASNREARVHPGLYQRRHGAVDLSTLHGPGFGYRIDEIGRDLPQAAVSFGATAT